MRLFIAINFDRQTKANLVNVQNHLREYGSGNFTREDNLHLTLAFLGEISPDRLDTIKAVMDRISVPQLKLTFSEIGCFRNDSELWWIGTEKNEKLLQLQRELSDGLKSEGFKLESRKFSPHITLARKMHAEMIDREKVLGMPFATETDAISLMLSERVDGKLVYTELHRQSNNLHTRWHWHMN